MSAVLISHDDFEVVESSWGKTFSFAVPGGEWVEGWGGREGSVSEVVLVEGRVVDGVGSGGGVAVLGPADVEGGGGFANKDGWGWEGERGGGHKRC